LQEHGNAYTLHVTRAGKRKKGFVLRTCDFNEGGRSNQWGYEARESGQPDFNTAKKFFNKEKKGNALSAGEASKVENEGVKEMIKRDGPVNVFSIQNSIAGKKIWGPVKKPGKGKFFLQKRVN